MSRRELLGAHNPGTINMRWDAATSSFLVWDGSAFAKVGSLGAWTTWGALITSGTGTITAATLNYATHMRVGRFIAYRISTTITNNGTGATSVDFTLPVDSVASQPCGSGFSGSTGKMLQAFAGTTKASGYVYDFTYPGGTSITLYFGGVYEGLT